MPGMHHTLTFQHFTTPAKLYTYDFERLYTNLDHAHLKQQLCALLQLIFELYPGQGGAASYITVCRDGPASWHFGPLPHPACIRTPDGPGHCFDLASAQEAVCHLIDQSYILVSDRVYRQSIDIPMGTNPAVYLANHYLFMLERQFFRSVLDLLHRSPQHSPASREALSVLDTFAYTRRYIDDLILITYSTAAQVQQYFYSSTVSPHGIPGIYPDFLRLEGTFQEPAISVDFSGPPHRP